MTEEEQKELDLWFEGYLKIVSTVIDRVPRKKKKLLKKMWKHRYGHDWFKSKNVIVEYRWFFKNPLKYDMTKEIYSIQSTTVSPL